ncbi:hypothetical protein [Bacillus thuringiensis]|uniref:hypothetical protein n=1 Tax=Bacillus thuringiensis TaxID=1428 RepID=UPI000BF3C1BC|nr:hypothetical protein [Bacillus thuringiensis]PFS65526.1 hypothetical protein COK87_01950 [Bacillus thuringiensis]
MLNENIKQIYDLLNSPVLTPYNLLENAKLDNYSYVNYYKGESGIICEMKCIVEDDTEVLYFYHFDKNDYLFRVYMEQLDKEKVIVFDREQELNNTVNKYLSTKQQNTAAI